MHDSKGKDRYTVEVKRRLGRKPTKDMGFTSANGALSYITDILQSDQQSVRIHSPDGQITFDELRQKAEEEIGLRQRA